MTSTTSERDLPAARHAGERIHAILWAKRMKQKDLAHAVGVGTPTFSKKLRGDVPITVDELMTIAGVLGVDPGDLLPRLDSNQQPSGYVSLQVGNVIPITRRTSPPVRGTPRQNPGDTSSTVGEQRGNSGQRLNGQEEHGRGAVLGGHVGRLGGVGGARGLRRVE